jgi:thioredoxin reductase (NADPH)
VIGGKATLVHGAKCVGHGLCAEECPVGAITMLMAAPGRSADLPVLTETYETTQKNIFIAGELGGMGLIKNAITQGKKVVEHIASTLAGKKLRFPVAVIGAGPAGLAAALTAKKNNLDYLLLDQGDVGGTILQYPRRKIVMTSPVEIPLWGKLKFTEASKETLREAWAAIIKKTGLQVHSNEKVLDIERVNELFRITSSKGAYEASHIVLALGRRGTPRKLGVPGEAQSKVMYRLIDTESYQDCDILVVGGGDSAIEAAVGLCLQGTNRVTLSYRKGEFSRIKDRNAKHLDEQMRKKSLTVILNSNVKEILEKEVVLETAEGDKSIPNQYVFIFVGGEMPFDFLKKIGIEFQQQVVK